MSGLVVIGSGAAGVSAAETFRARHPNIPVRILTTDPALPYAKPPLSKDFLCDRDTRLDLHSAAWFDRNRVELIRGVTVRGIDVERQEVVTAGGRRYAYWHLVVASGSAAVRPPVAGIESALTLRSFADAVALKMAARYADCAVVIGAGLIGCEAASCLAGRGVATMIVAAEHVPLQRRFGAQAGERVAKILSDTGVRFAGDTTVAAIEDGRVVLGTGETVEADLVVSAAGVRPDIRLAEAAGIATRDGRIVVDEHMHTSARNVYAAGDVALAHNVTAGRPIPAEHWRDAAHQGRVAGLTAAGFSAVWDIVPSYASVIDSSVLRYRGWGAGYERSRFVEHHNGFTVWYESGDDVVGVLTLNADDDYRRAEQMLRSA
ncbi:Pyridine nucleotide-disulphide oxidoreductase [Mycolicibacterium rutilum]|uniref:Pyridine nucleotide-disulphide oxidoreductase n=1 Tax=Mycolicibacterium rutilum TaxID=370526 RepID=A0A1H6ICX9_MYCRU|nr:Pyridine nucleotide-disulphide oxidoreductase [Mycolicibacterium rutilum]